MKSLWKRKAEIGIKGGSKGHRLSLNQMPLEEQEIESFRVFCLVLTALIPILGMISKFFDATLQNYTLDRLVIAFIGFGVILSSYKSRIIRSNLSSIVYFIGYAVTTWMILVVSINQFSLEYVLGLVTIIFASSLAFKTINQLSWYFFYTIPSVSLACFLSPTSFEDRGVLISSIAIVGLVSFMILRWRIFIKNNLEISENFMKTIFSESTDALFLVDLNKKEITECNSRAVAMFHAENKEHLLKENFYKFSHPGIVEKINGQIRKTMERSSIWSEEVRFSTFQNQWLWGDTTIKQIQISNVPYNLVRISDISDKKRAEEELSWLASFPEKTPIPIVELNLEGQVTYLNPIASRLFPDLKKLGLAHPILCDILPYVKQLLELKKDGSFREVKYKEMSYHQNVSLVTDKNLIRLFNIDISERIQAEKKIMISEAKSRALINAIPDSMLRINKEGVVLDYVHPQNGELNIYSDNIAGQSVYKILPDNVALQLKSHIEESLDLEKGQLFEFQLIANDKLCDFEARIVKSGEAELLIIIRDMSQGKEISRNLIASREAALQASRLKTDFVANVSHEMRTPLNGILGFTELVLDMEESKEKREFLNIVYSSGKSLLSLINDLLDFSKIEAGKLTIEKAPFELRDCVENTLNPFTLKAKEKGLKLSLSISDDVPNKLIGAPGRLRQILSNLMENALKFTERGEVSLSISAANITAKEVTLRFSVRDTGVGISKDKLGIIFDPFSQADGSSTREFGGTGLGLAITTQLLDLMDGKIAVDSEVDRGSQFNIEVEFLLQESTSTYTKISTKELADLNVLVVESDPVLQSILDQILRNSGMKPVIRGLGGEALLEVQKAHAEKNPFTLVIIDSALQDTDGFSLVKEIRENNDLDDVKFIMITFSGARGDSVRCRQLGISAYLTQPTKHQKLVDTILLVMKDSNDKDQNKQNQVVTRHFLRELGNTAQILLVEDNLINQELIMRIFEKQGFRVKIAQNGKLALNFLEKSRFDLILMDLQMPVMNGIETTRAIRQKERETGIHTPIIALTAHAREEDRKACLQEGMDGFIAKPIQKNELLHLAEQFLNNETPKTHADAIQN
jgi:PAS domain S-box-containing protein